MTIYTVNSDQNDTLQLGRQGEYNVTQFVFDLSDIAELVGDGTAVMVHYPYSGEPYIVPAEAGETYDAAVQDGTTLTWTIGQLATLYKGDGIAVVSWVTESGLKKSKRYKTKCLKAIEESGTDISDVQQAYIDQMAQLTAELIAEMQAASETTEEIETDVENAKTEISSAAEAAVTNVTNAVSEATAKIEELQEAVGDADDKIAEITAAGTAAVEAAQAAANVTVNGECLVYGGSTNG